jgi:phage-related minor tail protein
MPGETDSEAIATEFQGQIGRIDAGMQGVMRTADAFSRIMTVAFAQSAIGARNFDDALKSVGLRLSGMVVNSTMKSLLDTAMSGLVKSFAPQVSFTNAQRFATGGVINTPSYFPLGSGGVGLAGEAGPEAIMPLARGSDGRLGVAAGGAGAAHITVNIATPDAASFRRSEVFLTGQIARAVARGQRGL